MALEDKISICDKCGWQFMTKPNQKQSRNKCEHCGGQFIHTNITAEEMYFIEETSKDHDFIMAMNELKKNDIIEYELKMSQFRSQVEANKHANAIEKNIPKCPTCQSTNIRKIGTGERAVSILGFGILSKKINKTWKCNDCGHTW